LLNLIKLGLQTEQLNKSSANLEDEQGASEGQFKKLPDIETESSNCKSLSRQYLNTLKYFFI
jgi:hypothetical protein